MAEKQWAGTTFGSGGMHEALIRILRHTDVRLVYLFAWIFVVPVCLVLNQSRKTAWSFYRVRLDFGLLKAIWYTYKNHCCFAMVVIDRFAMYAGKKFDVEVSGRDLFDSLASEKDGFIQLSSHIGNYEMAGYLLHSGQKTIHALVYSDEKESVMRGRSRMFAKTNVDMIALNDDMNCLLEIDSVICRGDIVSIAADRHIGNARCIASPFLGAEAKFPQGSFSIAAMRSLNVLAINVMKVGMKQYRIYVTKLEYGKTLPRKMQVQQLCRAYISELERMVWLYPAQWYNFFDFWA